MLVFRCAVAPCSFHVIFLFHSFLVSSRRSSKRSCFSGVRLAGPIVSRVYVKMHQQQNRIEICDGGLVRECKCSSDSGNYNTLHDFGFS